MAASTHASEWARDAEARGLHAFVIETIGPLVGWVVAARVELRTAPGRFVAGRCDRRASPPLTESA